jgi:hypothetical protein
VPTLKSLASAAQSKLPDRTSSAYLIELDKNTDAPAKGLKDKASYVGFQYFPDSLNDSKQINYQQKEIPGGSLPLYQWVSSGERLISFTAVFTCDVDYGAGSLISEEDAANIVNISSSLRERLQGAGQLQRNPDLRGAVAWLRRYMLPTYSNDYTFAPNKLRLYLPNSGIGYAGGSDETNTSRDSIHCVMTQCDVTYEAFFPSGFLRAITVSLAFAQIPQFNGGVFFPHANDGSGIQTIAAGYTAIFPKG